MMKNRRLSKKVVSVLTVAAMGMALLAGCGDSGKAAEQRLHRLMMEV